MNRKNEARRATPEKRSNQTSKKNRKRSSNLGTRKGITNKAAFSSELNWLLGDQNIFAADAFHGNSAWDPRELVWQAVIWSLQETKRVTDAFDHALTFCEKLGLKKTTKTYPRFMNALTRYKVLGTRVRSRLQERAEEIAGRFWRDSDWTLFAFDGSRVSVPRTVSNEKAFCAPNFGKGKTAKYRKKLTKGMRRKMNEKAKAQPQAPQVWITMVWHMGLRISWTWRVGPSNSSERGHVEEILSTEEFPEETLFCGDAGFVGFPLWSKILSANADFLIRVGGNVELISAHADYDRLKGGVVLCWPKDMMRRGVAPLRLRLVKVKIGKTTMWMLTSVLDRKKLSLKQIIRYYKMRWGIEVEFRGLKQTLGNQKLCCRNCDNVAVELEWSIIGMAVAELLALRKQIPAGSKSRTDSEYSTTDRSLAKALRAIRSSMTSPDDIPKQGKSLTDQLAKALVQRYKNRTDKKARYRPPNPHKKPLKDPSVRKPNADERNRLRELDVKIAA